MKPFHLNKQNHCHIQGEEMGRLTRYYFICGFRFITKKLTGTIFKWNISFLSNRNSFLSMRLKFSYLIKNCIWSNQIKINPILLLFNLNEIFSRLTLNNNSRMPDKQKRTFSINQYFSFRTIFHLRVELQHWYHSVNIEFCWRSPLIPVVCVSYWLERIFFNRFIGSIAQKK